MKMLSRTAVPVVIVAAAFLAIAPSSLATAGCTDSWINSSGGNWDDGANWSTGSAPGSSDAVCINAAGTYTVVIGNETITASSLAIGGSGSSPTLQIGNNTGGVPDVSFTGAVDNMSGATLTFGYGGTFAAGSVTNEGTFEVANYAATSNLNAPFVNSGEVDVGGPVDVSLPDGTSWDNTSTGTVIVGAGGGVSMSSPSSPMGSFIQDGLLVNYTYFNVADAVTLNGGSICGFPIGVGSGDGGTGGTLSFAAKPTAGPSCSSGLPRNEVGIFNVTATLKTNIPKGYTVLIGDQGSGSATVSTPGPLVNHGKLEPGYGAGLTVAGDLTNRGTIIVPRSNVGTALYADNLINDGTFTSNAYIALNLATGDTLTNGAAGKLKANGEVVVVASVVNDGLLTLEPNGSLVVASNNGTASNFTQTSTGTLVDPIGKTFGILNVVNATAILGGTVNLGSKTFTPAYHGVYTFIEDAATSGTFATVTGPYTIAYNATSVQAIGQPAAAVKLSPASGTPPVAVKVTGAGYEAGETVAVYLDSTSGTPLASTKATSTGTISTTVTIPAGTSSGSHSIITLGQSSGQSASAPFTVS